MRFGLFFTFLSLFLIANSILIFAQTDNVTPLANKIATIKTIEVNVTLNKEKFSPGEKIKIIGTAKIGDDLSIDGTVKIKIGENYTVSLRGGTFSFETSLSDTIESGDHTIMIEVADNAGNIGRLNKQIYVLPLPTRLEVYLNNNSFSSDTNIEVSATLRDQNGKPIDAATIITLYDSRGAERVKAVIHDETFSFDLPKDAQPGDWWVYAYSDPLKTRRFFKVEESSRIETSISGNMLTVQNAGNVPYKNSILVNFLENGSSVSKSINLNLAVGAQTKIELSGSGKYELKISSQESENYFKGVSLTGGAIGAKVYGDNSKILIAFTILVLVIIAFALVLRKRTKKQI